MHPDLRGKPRSLRTAVRYVLIPAVVVVAVFVAVHFPRATDAEPSGEEIAKTISFYQQAYANPAVSADANPDSGDDIYVKVAAEAAQAMHIKEQVQGFVAEQHLNRKRVLDVGAGQGYLQDVVEDYTGLDISPTARRFFHKPFVLGSATAMPFPDDQFDAVWSIWVLEHIPNPEQALREMRRVVKDGGFIYLYPAWYCTTWAADGYPVRPYSDFNMAGKLSKATIPVRSARLYKALYVGPIRALRFAAEAMTGSPTRLHYTRLAPNYQKYWMPDSDAVSSIDRYEAMLWFLSRGDECLNCESPFRSLAEHVLGPLLIRVRKQANRQASGS